MNSVLQGKFRAQHTLGEPLHHQFAYLELSQHQTNTFAHKIAIIAYEYFFFFFNTCQKINEGNFAKNN